MSPAPGLTAVWLLIIFGFSAHVSGQFFQLPSPWAWVCRNATCVKVERDLNPTDSMSLIACKMVCGDYSALWPRPRSHLPITLSKTVVPFVAENLRIIKISSPAPASTQLATEAVKLFTNTVVSMLPAYASSPSFSHFVPETAKSHGVDIQILFSSPATALDIKTDESYSLTIDTRGSLTSVYIVAETFFGARHGLETLSQLIGWDDALHSLIILSAASFTDSPYYPHRGLLIDTSRNYMSIPRIKKLINGMAYNKLNVFHWHITDTHSFPFISKRNPLLALYGAYSANEVYTPEDIQDLVRYATVRGVKIIPEFDAPAHVGNGWQWGPKYGLGELALCINEEPWATYCVEPPCGQLNPVNENIYPIIGNIYRDMADVFQSDMFHMGGDEVKMDCWNKTEEILQWMKKRGLGTEEEDFIRVWSYFQNKALAELDQAYGKQQPVILWTSGLTEHGRADKYLDKSRYIIQIWTTATDETILDVHQKGYKMIMSNYDALYLDCGYGAWVGEGNNWCSPYIGWQKVYENSPKRLVEGFNVTAVREQLLGAEAALWAEQVDSATVEGKIWPRAAAMAERLWTEPEENWRQSEFRMIHQRQRLIERGIMADALQPEWCRQNEGLCYA